MMHNKLLKTLLLLALAVTVMLTASGCNLVMQWVSAPVKVDYSADAKERIERDIGIEPPPDKNFVIGYMISDREFTTAYIFEFPYEGRTNEAAQYVSDLLGLSATHASPVENNPSNFLVKLGFEFTHYFSAKGPFARVLYCINSDTLQIALVC